MNSLQMLLLDLLVMGEAPLYSSYRWFEQQMRFQMPLRDFLNLISDMLEQDLIRLWSVESQERTELYDLPNGLERRYRLLEHHDEHFDPLGLSLTLGTKSDARIQPSWEVELHFDQRTFEMITNSGSGPTALQELQRYFPNVDFTPEAPVLSNGKEYLRGHVTLRSN